MFCWGLRLLEQHRQNRLIFNFFQSSPFLWVDGCDPWVHPGEPRRTPETGRQSVGTAPWKHEMHKPECQWEAGSSAPARTLGCVTAKRRSNVSLHLPSFFSFSYTCLMIIVQHQDLILGYRGRKGQMMFSLVMLMEKIPIQIFSRKLKYSFFMYLFVCVSCQEGNQT